MIEYGFGIILVVVGDDDDDDDEDYFWFNLIYYHYFHKVKENVDLQHHFPFFGDFHISFNCPHHLIGFDLMGLKGLDGSSMSYELEIERFYH